MIAPRIWSKTWRTTTAPEDFERVAGNLVGELGRHNYGMLDVLATCFRLEAARVDLTREVRIGEESEPIEITCRGTAAGFQLYVAGKLLYESGERNP